MTIEAELKRIADAIEVIAGNTEPGPAAVVVTPATGSAAAQDKKSEVKTRAARALATALATPTAAPPAKTTEAPTADPFADEAVAPAKEYTQAELRTILQTAAKKHGQVVVQAKMKEASGSDTLPGVPAAKYADVATAVQALG